MSTNDPKPTAGRNIGCCWMARHSHGEDHVRMCVNYQGTGERILGKFEDDPYAAEPARDVFGVVAEAEQTFWKRYREMTSDERYAAPTPAEILMALGIVAAIIGVFCFVVIAYGL